MKKQAADSHTEDDGATLILLDEFDWIVYNRFYRRYPGASYVVGSMEFAPVTREEAALPAKGTREYRAFRRWQRGSLFERLADFVGKLRKDRENDHTP